MCEITNMQNILSTPDRKFRLAEKLPPPAGDNVHSALRPGFFARLYCGVAAKNFGREMVVSWGR